MKNPNMQCLEYIYVYNRMCLLGLESLDLSAEN
jgi:hypothetical protein